MAPSRSRRRRPAAPAEEVPREDSQKGGGSGKPAPAGAGGGLAGEPVPSRGQAGLPPGPGGPWQNRSHTSHLRVLSRLKRRTGVRRPQGRRHLQEIVRFASSIGFFTKRSTQSSITT